MFNVQLCQLIFMSFFVLITLTNAHSFTVKKNVQGSKGESKRSKDSVDKIFVGKISAKRLRPKKENTFVGRFKLNSKKFRPEKENFMVGEASGKKFGPKKEKTFMARKNSTRYRTKKGIQSFPAFHRDIAFRYHQGGHITAESGRGSREGQGGTFRRPPARGRNHRPHYFKEMAAGPYNGGQRLKTMNNKPHDFKTQSWQNGQVQGRHIVSSFSGRKLKGGKQGSGRDIGDTEYKKISPTIEKVVKNEVNQDSGKFVVESPRSKGLEGKALEGETTSSKFNVEKNLGGEKKVVNNVNQDLKDLTIPKNRMKKRKEKNEVNQDSSKFDVESPRSKGSVGKTLKGKTTSSKFNVEKNLGGKKKVVYNNNQATDYDIPGDMAVLEKTIKSLKMELAKRKMLENSKEEENNAEKSKDERFDEKEIPTDIKKVENEEMDINENKKSSNPEKKKGSQKKDKSSKVLVKKTETRSPELDDENNDSNIKKVENDKEFDNENNNSNIKKVDNDKEFDNENNSSKIKKVENNKELDNENNNSNMKKVENDKELDNENSNSNIKIVKNSKEDENEKNKSSNPDKGKGSKKQDENSTSLGKITKTRTKMLLRAANSKKVEKRKVDFIPCTFKRESRDTRVVDRRVRLVVKKKGSEKQDDGEHKECRNRNSVVKKIFVHKDSKGSEEAVEGKTKISEFNVEKNSVPQAQIILENKIIINLFGNTTKHSEKESGYGEITKECYDSTSKKFGPCVGKDSLDKIVSVCSDSQKKNVLCEDELSLKNNNPRTTSIKTIKKKSLNQESNKYSGIPIDINEDSKDDYDVIKKILRKAFNRESNKGGGISIESYQDSGEDDEVIKEKKKIDTNQDRKEDYDVIKKILKKTFNRESNKGGGISIESDRNSSEDDEVTKEKKKIDFNQDSKEDYDRKKKILKKAFKKILKKAFNRESNENNEISIDSNEDRSDYDEYTTTPTSHNFKKTLIQESNEYGEIPIDSNEDTIDSNQDSSDYDEYTTTPTSHNFKKTLIQESNENGEIPIDSNEDRSEEDSNQDRSEDDEVTKEKNLCFHPNQPKKAIPCDNKSSIYTTTPPTPITIYKKPLNQESNENGDITKECYDSTSKKFGPCDGKSF